MRSAAAVLTISTLFALGCGSSPTAPSSTEPDTTVATELFAGGLETHGAQFYSFTVAAAGSVKILLASVTRPPAPDALLTPLGLGVGQPAGTGCAMTASMETTAALAPQLVTTLQPGIYCANVYDPSTLAAPVTFIVRITHS